MLLKSQAHTVACNGQSQHRAGSRRAGCCAAALLLGAALFLAACRGPQGDNPASGPLTVSAAADLTYAFQEIGEAFEAETGNTIVFNFGSTGQLAQQIEQGAPVDLFAAANVSFIEDLERQGLILAGTKQLYARGRLTLWLRADSPLEVSRIEDLTQPGIRRIAIANPDHAPYGGGAAGAAGSRRVGGRAARLVLGENIRQTLQYAETGNVDVAIAALSLSVPAAAAGGEEGRWTWCRRPAPAH